MVTAEITTLMQDMIIYDKELFYTDIWPIEIDYDVWIYNCIPDMQYCIYYIEVWLILRFDTVSDTLSYCHVWGCTTYILEPNL